MMKIFSVDPGLKGGMSIYSQDGLLASVKTPVMKEPYVRKGKPSTRNTMDLAAIRDFIEEHKPDRGVLEKVSSRPGEGSTSSFRFGLGLGEWRGLLTALRIPFIMPTPRVWKKELGLGSDKEDSLVMAREMWPDFAIPSFKFKNCDGVAESAILAKYGYDHPELFEE
jgi:hypothetical protein